MFQAAVSVVHISPRNSSNKVWRRYGGRRLVLFGLLGLVELLDGTEVSWTAGLGISTS